MCRWRHVVNAIVNCDKFFYFSLIIAMKCVALMIDRNAKKGSVAVYEKSVNVSVHLSGRRWLLDNKRQSIKILVNKPANYCTFWVKICHNLLDKCFLVQNTGQISQNLWLPARNKFCLFFLNAKKRELANINWVGTNKQPQNN